ncbi:MAG TPA: hypothetical protein VJW20_09505 [Candidatus Angelobacter sp.]|nr:hypothetical protein [Candidatus Angelobacter sp.]
MPTGQNEIQNNLYAGLYLQTKRQTRFWGWSRRGWGSLHAETERSTMGLAAWLRQAHACLDNDECSPLNAESTTEPLNLATEFGAKQSRRNHRRLEFVCNRRMIGLLIR